MSSDPQNLVLEQLRHIRATTDKTNGKVAEIERQVIEMRLQRASLAREDASVLSRLSEFEARVERIETRLGLTE